MSMYGECVCMCLVLPEAISYLITQNIYPGSNNLQVRAVDKASICLGDPVRPELVASFQFMIRFRIPASL